MSTSPVTASTQHATAASRASRATTRFRSSGSKADTRPHRTAVVHLAADHRRPPPTPVVLVRFGAADVDELTELLTDAWYLRAPKRGAPTSTPRPTPAEQRRPYDVCPFGVMRSS